mmetsp:Transcript_24968/g.49705  ORF Transcript_24968/g.49705 Transcript_24968/m.49705 type:complete len:251 (-) Transcript_24968:116-868(-)|eukprot:CAMPEP_0182460250 /NCGR_PEP_ID=MMETSP1319-20130603/5168_1 /TAXON_ID=172717 /ORGANISM="Bolidomonas pacifica, Strain RCC208" /LENGTH=250 /DNA_ID=CAMNT_0024659321 /DNA_START=258 /DNA_END=1010 /DNA_ORIENTATION=+
MLANASRSFIRSRLAVTSQVTSPLNVSWVPHDDHESLSEIYRLRYKVMVSDAAKSKKGNPFAPDHYCLHEGPGGMEFRDEYDELPSTGHCLVRFNGAPVASTRIVDGNHTPLEAEKFGWIDIRSRIAPHVINPNNIAEPSRVVADKSIRGSCVVPLMYLHCLDWFMSKDIENFIGMCNTSARPLIEHYSKWAQTKWITDEPFSADDFIEGRKLEMCYVSVGTKGTRERDNFLMTNFTPAFMAYSVMKNPR